VSFFSGTREWIYTRNIGGTYQVVHRWSGRLLIGGMFLLPWLSFRGHPLVMADLPARRLYLAGQIFTAANGYLMVLGALISAFLLFFVSAVFGRLWCGYLCPQTVFLEEWVRRIEALVEGDGAVRARRDRGPWNFDKLWRKSTKVGLLAVLALVLGMTVISYFAGAYPLWSGQGGSSSYTLVAVIAGFALADWLWFREQLCIYLCPYARFQSALTDNHSLTVGFNPNVEIKAGKASGEAGNCIDCKKCVQVCPMGIDIRDGNMQLECINCARCIDACETVMPKLGHPTLVRYTTVARDQGRATKVVRPRTVIYGALITGLAVALMSGVAFHNPVEITLHRSPGALYQVDDDGFVRNTYLLRVVNNDAVGSHTFAIGVEGLENVQVTVPPLFLASGEDRTVPVVVRVPVATVKNTMPVRIVVHSDGRTRSIDSTFKGPNG
jgi:cytochrome c oxidase accessory protein FixG